MSPLLHSAARRVLPAIIAVLLVTQAASSVCSAQCMQHQHGTPSAGHDPAMTDCHSMVVPEANGAAVQNCPAKTYSPCVIDLLANSQRRLAAPLLVNADWRPDNLLPGLNITSFAPVYPSLRSSVGDPPLITPLRV